MLRKIEIENFKTFINKTVIDYTTINYKFLKDENDAFYLILY